MPSTLHLAGALSPPSGLVPLRSEPVERPLPQASPAVSAAPVTAVAQGSVSALGRGGEGKPSDPQSDASRAYAEYAARRKQATDPRTGDVVELSRRPERALTTYGRVNPSGPAYDERTTDKSGRIRAPKAGESLIEGQEPVDEPLSPAITPIETAPQGDGEGPQERPDAEPILPPPVDDVPEPKTAARPGAAPSEPANDPVDEQLVQDLKARDQEVRTHEMAHKAVGGSFAGAISYAYETGPDGKRYAVGGEVPIDISPVRGEPAVTVAKMQQVRRAALAPAEPSGADRAVAAAAAQRITEAQVELQKEANEPSDDEPGVEETPEESSESAPQSSMELDSQPSASGAMGAGEPPKTPESSLSSEASSTPHQNQSARPLSLRERLASLAHG